MTDTQERKAVLVGLDTAARIRPDGREGYGYLADLCLALPGPMRVGELHMDGDIIWSAQGAVPHEHAPAEVIFRRIGDADGRVGYLSVTLVGLPIFAPSLPTITARPMSRAR